MWIETKELNIGKDLEALESGQTILVNMDHIASLQVYGGGIAPDSSKRYLVGATMADGKTKHLLSGGCLADTVVEIIHDIKAGLDVI